MRRSRRVALRDGQRRSRSTSRNCLSLASIIGELPAERLMLVLP